MDNLMTNPDNSLLNELFAILTTLPTTWESLEDCKNSVHNIIQQTFNNFLITQSIEYQKNTEFKKFLATSIENIVMASLHEKIYALIRLQFAEEDEMIYNKCKELAALKVTADQLGASEEYAIPLPAAVCLF